MNDKTLRAWTFCLINNPEMVDQTRVNIKDLPESYQIVVEAVFKLYEAKDDISVNSIAESVKSTGNASKLKLSFLSDLVSEVWNYHNWQTHEERLLSEIAYLKLKSTLDRVQITLEKEGYDTAIDQLDMELVKVDHGFKEGDMRDHIKEAVNQFEKAYREKIMLRGIDTHFSNLNNVTQGWAVGEVSVLGARPSIGKTTFALQEALLISEDVNTLVVSLEMPATSLVNKCISVLSGVKMSKIQSGFVNKQEVVSIQSAFNDLGEKKLHIVDPNVATIGQIRGFIRKYARKHDVKFVVIDYLTLIRYKDDKQDKRHQVGDSMKALKALAKELKIHIMVLSQLTRDTENKRPHLGNLKESSDIEQDADMVLLMHREERDSEDTEIIVAKNRNGMIGLVDFTFKRDICSFQERQEDYGG